MSAPVDALAVRAAEILSEKHSDGTPVGRELLAIRIARPEQRNAVVSELIARTNAVASTLESSALVKQSKTNENAGFIDWRDWCALRGEVMALRAALVRVGAA